MSELPQAGWAPPTESQPAATPVPPPVTASFAPPAPPAPPGRRRSGKLLAATGVLAAAALGGLAGAGIMVAVDDDPAPTRVAANGDATSARPDATPVAVLPGGEIDVPAVAREVAGSVVTVISDVSGAADTPGSVPPPDSIPAPEGAGAIGTGIVLDTNGEILTNAHVIEGFDDVHVRLPGETEPRDAEIVASDRGNDLALIRLTDTDSVELRPAQLADPDAISIGEPVVAIGFALDLDGAPSVTLGIVSALDRTILSERNNGALDGLIQTDAAISSGNSGGPLVNAAGQVVGINTAVARSDFSTAANGVGFAISMAEARPVIEQLREQAGGEPREEAFLGVLIDDRRDGGQGALVTSVDEGTPAADAGIQADDVVIALDGEPVVGSAGLIAAFRDLEPGAEVAVTLIRDGAEQTVTATLTSRPED